MMRILAGAAATVVAAFLMMANPASAQVAGARMAAPFAAPAAASDVVQVQWRRRYWGGPRFYRGYPYRRGWGYWGPGFATGLVLGGALAAPYAYGSPYGYRAYPADDGAVAYCMRRFRSFDPQSMTYLGYDGLRHSCP